MNYDWIMWAIVLAWLAFVCWLSFKDKATCALDGYHLPDYKTMRWGDTVSVEAYGLKYETRCIEYTCKRCGHVVQEVSGI